LWHHLPRHIGLKGVRADAGSCLPERMALWEQFNLPYVVVAQLRRPNGHRSAMSLPFLLPFQNPRNQSRRVVVEDGFDVLPLGEAELRAGLFDDRRQCACLKPCFDTAPPKW